MWLAALCVCVCGVGCVCMDCAGCVWMGRLVILTTGVTVTVSCRVAPQIPVHLCMGAAFGWLALRASGNYKLQITNYFAPAVK